MSDIYAPTIATGAGPATSEPPAPLTPEEAFARPLYPERVALKPDPGSLYSTAGYFQTAFGTNLPRLGDAGVLTLAQQEQERVTFPEVIRKSGIHPWPFGERLHDLWTARRLEVEDKATAARRAATREATHKALRLKLGDKAFEALKPRVGRWVRSQSALHAIVEFGGIGNELDIAEAIYEHVRMNGLGLDAGPSWMTP